MKRPHYESKKTGIQVGRNMSKTCVREKQIQTTETVPTKQ